MNSVSPAAVQYGSPEGTRRAESRDAVTGRHTQSQMGYQGGAREGETDEVEKIKSKLLTAWNNVKYGWTVKMKTSFSPSSPLLLLGDRYLFKLEDDVERFQKDFVSRVWLTYRRDFPALEGTTLTTDCGWGCMIRSAQMLLAHGLLVHLLSRAWLWPDALLAHVVDMEPVRSSSPSRAPILPPPFPSPLDRGRSPWDPQTLRRRPPDPLQEKAHRDILRWFSDHPGAPFGLHRMVALGGSLGKKAGDWYGPSIVAHIIRKALERTSQVPDLSVYVSQDCTVYRTDVEQLLDGGDSASDTSRGRAVIILVPVRLGGESFNPVYTMCIKEFLRLPSCLGIIGGKPKHSLYFVGYQDNYLLYLDPHYCQPYIDTSKDDFPLESFHCNSPRKISITRMDPSCTIAFYSRNRTDFATLCADLSRVLGSPTAEEKYPIFSIADGQAQEYEEGSHRCSHTPARPPRARLAKKLSSDEFVFL
ncbi:cysteine protease ATG4D isoform X1 [Ascaphus truei]|uniref:cysteine protease ATG4D isoform X1 n=1 Tax=Ascaphus truei TaxID=8439 RepID=UPI003F5A4989